MMTGIITFINELGLKLYMFGVKQKEIPAYYSKYEPILRRRLEYKKNREFETADKIREYLSKEGIEIKQDGIALYTIWGYANSDEQSTTWVYK